MEDGDRPLYLEWLHRDEYATPRLYPGKYWDGALQLSGGALWGPSTDQLGGLGQRMLTSILAMPDRLHPLERMVGGRRKGVEVAFPLGDPIIHVPVNEEELDEVWRRLRPLYKRWEQVP